jgi:hypothetical protein
MLVVIISHRYIVEEVDDAAAIRVRSLDAPLCPDCRSLCSGYDARSRRVVGDDGRVTVYRLRRVRCPACEMLHIELPDFMRPLKRYAASVIDDVLGGGGACCPADERTMRRWRQKITHP